MLEELKKVGRIIQRRRIDYENREVAGILFGGMAAVPFMIAGAFTVGLTVAATLIPTLYCAIYMYGKTALQKIGKTELDSGQETIGSEWSGVNLQCTQKCIFSLTEKFKNATQLPTNIEKKIQDYLGDAAEFAAQVHAYDAQGQEQDEIIFTREVFDAQGQETKIPVGAVKTIKGLAMSSTVGIPVPAAKSPAPSGIKIAPQPLQFKNRPAQNIK